MPTCQTPCHRHLPVTCSSSASIAEEEVLRTWPILGKVTLKASRSLTHHKCSPPPIITVQWETAMQAIADRYPSTTDYLFSIIKSDDKIVESREIGRVRENITKALKLIATRCNLSVVPSLKMTKDIYQHAIDNVSVSKII